MCRKFSELDKPPQISIKVLAVASQGEETKPWRDVIREVCNNHRTADLAPLNPDEVIEAIINRGVVKRSKRELAFSGTLHCEACLASLLQSGALDKELDTVSW